MAKWLHGFYASHANLFLLKVETLLKLCGSEDASPSSGRQKLGRALDSVAGASAASGQPGQRPALHPRNSRPPGTSKKVGNWDATPALGHEGRPTKKTEFLCTVPTATRYRSSG